MWDECNCAVVWTFFGTAFLWDWNENWPFPDNSNNKDIIIHEFPHEEQTKTESQEYCPDLECLSAILEYSKGQKSIW